MPIVKVDGITMFVCGGRQRQKRCKCGKVATRECDFPMRGKLAGKTCDEPLCDLHSLRVGAEDYCGPHSRFMESESK